MSTTKHTRTFTECYEISLTPHKKSLQRFSVPKHEVNKTSDTTKSKHRGQCYTVTSHDLQTCFRNGSIRPYRAERSHKFVEHWKIDDHSDRFVALICRTSLSYFLPTPFTWSLLAEGLMNILTHATVLKLIPFAFHRIFANATEKPSILKINFPRPKLASTRFEFLLTAVCSA